MANLKLRKLTGNSGDITKTTPLSHTDVDSNFINLDNDISELRADFESFGSLDMPSGSSLIGYLPQGTSAVSRTVQNKLQESVSLRDFGAVGNANFDVGPAVWADAAYTIPATDDSAAFKLFMAHCITNKVAGYIPSGSYLITSSDPIVSSVATPKNNITIFGDGTSSKLVMKGDFTLFNFSGAGLEELILDTSIKDVKIYSVTGNGCAISLNLFQYFYTNANILNTARGIKLHDGSEVRLDGAVAGCFEYSLKLSRGIRDMSVVAANSCVFYTGSGNTVVMDNVRDVDFYGCEINAPNSGTGYAIKVLTYAQDVNFYGGLSEFYTATKSLCLGDSAVALVEYGSVNFHGFKFVGINQPTGYPVVINNNICKLNFENCYLYGDGLAIISSGVPATSPVEIVWDESSRPPEAALAIKDQRVAFAALDLPRIDKNVANRFNNDLRRGYCQYDFQNLANASYTTTVGEFAINTGSIKLAPGALTSVRLFVFDAGQLVNLKAGTIIQIEYIARFDGNDPINLPYVVFSDGGVVQITSKRYGLQTIGTFSKCCATYVVPVGKSLSEVRMSNASNTSGTVYLNYFSVNVVGPYHVEVPPYSWVGVPTNGYFNNGDIVTYKNKTGVGPSQAYCITAGSPGVWKEAAIDSVGMSALAAPTGASLAGYMPAGTGTVPRTVQNKLRERTSIFDFMTEAEIYSVQYWEENVSPLVDVSDAINRALAYLAKPDMTYSGKPNELFFPNGVYNCAKELLIKGPIAIVGEGAPMSITGARILQVTDNLSLFVARNLGNMAVYFSNVMLGNRTSSANENNGLFSSESTVTSGNSYYFRDCWFSTPRSFAVNIQSDTDDVTIHGCTFDVSTTKFIRLGTATAISVNFSIIGNTFYRGNTGGGQGMIDIYKANAGIISGNRFYNSDGGNAPYAVSIKTNQVQHVIIDGNTCWGFQKLLESQSGNLTITNNRVFADDSGYGPTSAIVFAGLATISNVIVANNYLEGNSGIYGIIDATGVTVTQSIFKNNILKNIGTSAYAMRLEPQAYVSGSNIISDNINIGCGVDGSSQTISFTPTINCGATPGVFVYTTQVGKATVVGTKLLAVQIEITIGTVTTPGSGEARIFGIPFVAAEKSFGTLLCENIANPDGPTGYTQTSAVVSQAANHVRIFYSGGGLGFNPLQGPKLVAGSSIYCSFLMQI